MDLEASGIPFLSYAQNGEDVVLWRALRHVQHGTYVDVGACDPTTDSVTKAFYDRGWRGVNVEPVPRWAERLRERRPEDVTVDVVLADTAGTTTLFENEDTGLSTLVPGFVERAERIGYHLVPRTVPTRTLDDVLEELGFDGRDLHFLKVDVEGAEALVLRGADLARWRPWVVVVEATEPLSTVPTWDEWEPLILAHGYRRCLFDGLNVFYVSDQHLDLQPALSYPAGIFDEPFSVVRKPEVADAVDSLRKLLRRTQQDALAWRSRALVGEAAVTRVQAEIDHVHASTSWRLTAPVRLAKDMAAPRARALARRAEATAKDRISESQKVRLRALRARASDDRPSIVAARPPVAGSAAAVARHDPASMAALEAFSRRVLTAQQALFPDVRIPVPSSIEEVSDWALRALERTAATETLPASARAWVVPLLVHGRYPSAQEASRYARTLWLDGPAGMAGLAWSDFLGLVGSGAVSMTEIAFPPAGSVLVDVSHTASHDFHTGIQRVVRETAGRWVHDHGAVLVAWRGDGFTALVLDEVERFLSWRERVGKDPHWRPRRVFTEAEPLLVPWQATVLLPELVVDPSITDPLRVLASSKATAALAGIGYDIIPVTSSETVATGLSGSFAGYLSVVKHIDRVSAISEASAEEFRGFSMALGSQGLRGPNVVSHLLPGERTAVDSVHLDQVRSQFELGTVPLVLVVGSHEPRKNHLAVLEVAERLWREGCTFSLLFIGGGVWRGEEFAARISALSASGRPVAARRGIDEQALWATYQLARFTIFPSLSEGFGLPITESLSCGTPAITSNFGSMAEIAALGGVVTVDPRDLDSLYRATRTLLTDDDVLQRLRAEAAAITWKSWDQYATEVWRFLVDGVEPS